MSRSSWLHRHLLAVLRPALAGCLTVAVASPAAAQIYSWRDASGRLVLSNRAPHGSVDVASSPVPTTHAIRTTTRSAAAERAMRFDGLIAEHARLNDVRADLVRAVVQVESAFDPDARSPKGAAGLMQLMPATLRDFGVSNPYSPSENIRAGVAYLRQLLDRYQNNEPLALAAYNAGPRAVDRHGQRIPPFRETRSYVAQVGRLAPPAAAPRLQPIYKAIETIDGRPVMRYTDKQPTSGVYEVVGSR